MDSPGLHPPWRSSESFPIPQRQPDPPPRKRSFIDELFSRFGTVDQILAQLARAIEISPVDSRLDLQVFLNAVGREEESFTVSKDLMRLAPKDPRVLFNHGWHWLKRGELKKAMTYLEYGRALNTYGHSPLPSTQPLWNPEGGKGQRVLLVLEGGLGDEIIHFRFGKDLAERHGCRVTVVCNPSLVPLFEKERWVSGLAQREAALGIYHDSWLPGMSAALALGYEYSDLSAEPYLHAHPEEVRLWAKRLGDLRGAQPRGHAKKLKVGIRWAGNPQFEHQQLRRFSPDLFIGLAELPGVEAYSFQRDNDLVDLPPCVTDLGPHLKTWSDTAAALANMDLVISSCTSVAHLSAAMGKKTWIVVPALPYFPWAPPGRTSVWYRSVTLFRQKQFGTWGNVGEDLRRELAEFVAKAIA